MSREFGATLGIRIKIDDHCEITIQNASKEPLKISSKLARHQLSSVRAELRQNVGEAVSNLKSVTQVSMADVSKSLLGLHKSGRQLLYKLFGDEVTKLPIAMDMCQHACPNYKQPGWDSLSLAPHTIEVRTEFDYGIPIDILPLFDPSPPAPVQTLQELARVAGGLLGFSAVVNRQLGVPPPQQNRLQNIPRLPIKMFQDRSLPGARKEENFFNGKEKHIELDGPWPNRSAPSDHTLFCKTLARYLWHPEESFEGKPRDPPDQVCHFSCHCDTAAANPQNYRITLNSGELFWRSQKVKLDTLRDELLQLRLKSGASDRVRPLVFINACSSADLDPAGAGSFAELFLMKPLGFMGFIGTEALVPDAFASAFAEQFYLRLLSGRLLGRAVHEARWLELRRLNPVGILYSIYADPEIRVIQPDTSLLRSTSKPKKPTSGVWYRWH